MSRHQIAPKAPPARRGGNLLSIPGASDTQSTEQTSSSTSSSTGSSRRGASLFDTDDLGEVAAPSMSIFESGGFGQDFGSAFGRPPAPPATMPTSSSSTSSAALALPRPTVTTTPYSMQALRQPTPTGSSSSPSSGVVAAASNAATTARGAGYSLEELASNPVGVMEALVKSGVIPVIQNIVATFDVKCELDLREIAMKARNAEFNPKRFIALIMKIRDPKVTALVFKSGRIVVVGAKSERDARVAGRKFARILQNVGYPNIRFTDFTIRNVVASADVKFPIKLEQLVREHEQWATYEPELFPGLIYRMVSPKVVFLVFVTGKVVMTGAKTRADIYTAFEQIFHVLWTHKKADPVTSL